jgi:hypothetical protein
MIPGVAQVQVSQKASPQTPNMDLRKKPPCLELLQKKVNVQAGASYHG